MGDANATDGAGEPTPGEEEMPMNETDGMMPESTPEEQA